LYGAPSIVNTSYTTASVSGPADNG